MVMLLGRVVIGWCVCENALMATALAQQVQGGTLQGYVAADRFVSRAVAFSQFYTVDGHVQVVCCRLARFGQVVEEGCESGLYCRF